MADEIKTKKIAKGRTNSSEEAGSFLRAFISDGASDIGKYFIFDVIVPMLQKGLIDTLNMLFYGKSGTSNKTTATKVSYDRYYNNEYPREYGTVRQRSSIYSDVIVDNRGEAEEVLIRIEEIIEEYGAASVLDLYELVDLSTEHTSNKYGWTNLRNAKVVKVNDGYLISMPKPRPI